MKSRIDKLEAKVEALYQKDAPDRDEWADWLWKNHVKVVANYATELAEKYKADADIARACALLHDIADAYTKRRNPEHEAESLKTARKLLEETEYSPQEIALIVDDALKYHSCHGSERPESLEGKILATADALAHLETDFYVYAVWALGQEGKKLEDIKEWVTAKIERDLNKKILFDDVRENTRPKYEEIKAMFLR